jgi:sugar phosphate isomerase/epimerase
MKDFKLGLQLYTVRDDMDADMDAALGRVAEIGYKYVEFAGGYRGRSAEEVKELLDKHGLICNSVHQAPQMFIDQGQVAVDFFKKFNVKYVAIPHYPITKLAGSEEWAASKDKFIKAARVLKAHGMKLGYHNHDFEFDKVDGKYIHDYIFSEIDNDLIDPELDTCWVHYAGINPADKIREFAGRVEIVHLKDFDCRELGGGPAYDLIDSNGVGLKKKTREDNGFVFRPLGMGRQNFHEILTACEEAGTKLVIVEQDQTYDTPELEAARISREYLKGAFGI